MKSLLLPISCIQSNDCLKFDIKCSPYNFHTFQRSRKLCLQWALNINRILDDHDMICSKYSVGEYFTIQYCICKEYEISVCHNVNQMLSHYNFITAKRKRVKQKVFSTPSMIPNFIIIFEHWTDLNKDVKRCEKVYHDSD